MAPVAAAATAWVATASAATATEPLDATAAANVRAATAGVGAAIEVSAAGPRGRMIAARDVGRSAAIVARGDRVAVEARPGGIGPSRRSMRHLRMKVVVRDPAADPGGRVEAVART